jgi:hypothetical protein
VTRHALGDDVVVLDDEHLRHECIMQPTGALAG